jgi:cytidylate kinase
MQLVDQSIRVAAAQRQIIENFAKQGDCVIVGRGADVILEDMKPLNLFVYADMDSKVERCRQRAPEGENLSENELVRMIRQIDKQRAQHHQMYTDTRWGAKEGYHLCINTSGKEIKQMIPALAQFVRSWFGE